MKIIQVFVKKISLLTEKDIIKYIFVAISLGAKSFLVKPIKEDRLIEEIRKVQEKAIKMLL